MPSRDRVPGPSRWLCPQCAYDLAPRMTPLELAEHDVQHLKAHHLTLTMRNEPLPRSELELFVRRLMTLDDERQAYESSQRARICDLEEEQQMAAFDLKVANDLIDDLRADVESERRRSCAEE